jgi:Gpi18-like mannosyltransferase
MLSSCFFENVESAVLEEEHRDIIRWELLELQKTCNNMHNVVQSSSTSDAALIITESGDLKKIAQSIKKIELSLILIAIEEDMSSERTYQKIHDYLINNLVDSHTIEVVSKLEEKLFEMQDYQQVVWAFSVACMVGAVMVGKELYSCFEGLSVADRIGYILLTMSSATTSLMMYENYNKTVQNIEKLIAVYEERAIDQE